MALEPSFAAMFDWSFVESVDVSTGVRGFAEHNDPVTFPVVSYDCPPGQRRNPMLDGLAAAPGTHMGMQRGVTPAGTHARDKRSLIACERVADAQMLIDVLGLDESRWMAMGIGNPLMGWQFERAIVFYRVTRDTSDAEVRSATEWVQQLRLKADKVTLL